MATAPNDAATATSSCVTDEARHALEKPRLAMKRRIGDSRRTLFALPPRSRITISEGGDHVGSFVAVPDSTSWHDRRRVFGGEKPA